MALECESFIRTLPKIFNQIFCELMLIFKVISNVIDGPDNMFKTRIMYYIKVVSLVIPTLLVLSF